MEGFVLDRLENIMGKGENAGYQCFQKAAFPESLKPKDSDCLSLY